MQKINYKNKMELNLTEDLYNLLKNYSIPPRFFNFRAEWLSQRDIKWKNRDKNVLLKTYYLVE